jgi:hypothetical protein
VAPAARGVRCYARENKLTLARPNCETPEAMSPQRSAMWCIDGKINASWAIEIPLVSREMPIRSAKMP